MKSILYKSTAFFCCYYLLILFSACCNCDKQVYRKYSITDLVSTNIKYNIIDDSLYQIENIDTNNYQSNQYGIQLNFEIEKFSKNNEPKSLEFINKAYACKCGSYMKTS